MIEPTWYPNERQLRQFAVAALLGSGLIGLAVRMRFGAETLSVWLWGAGILVCLLGLFKPTLVRPLYTVLMVVFLPLGWLMSTLLLGILYYLILTPVGLALRIKGRDPLRVKRRQASSYWLDRKGERAPATYYRQS